MRRQTLEAASLTRGVVNMPVVVQRITPIGKQHASILFTTMIGSDRKVEEAAVASALSNMYKNKVRLCGGTVTRVFDGPRDVYRCFVALNRESVPYETASSEGWVNTAANLFADENDNLWEVSGEGADRLLCRVNTDDLLSVLAERRSRSVSTALSLVDSEPTITKHAAVLAFDTASEDVLFGIAISPNKMYVPEKNKLVNIESASALAIVAHDRDAPRFEGAPVETAASIATILEYYKRLYGHNTAFYTKLKALIEQALNI